MSKLFYEPQFSEPNPKRARVQLLGPGKWLHPKAPNGVFVVDPKLVDEIEQNFRNGVRGKEIPTNENHLDQNFMRVPAWIVDIERTSPDRLDAIVEFTDDQLADDVRKKKVRYFSPEIAFNWLNPADGRTYNVLKGAGWTNIPYMKGLDPATIINMSEVVGLSEYVSFDKAIDEITEELKESGYDGWEWEFRREMLKKSYEDIDGAEPEALAIVVSKCDAMIDEVKKSFKPYSPSGPDFVGIFARWENIMREHLQRKLDSTYDDAGDGKKSDDELHGAEFVNPSGQANDRSFKNSAEGDQTDDVNNADDKREPKSKPEEPNKRNALDPDAQDQAIPSQCDSCTHLQDGSCPFKGIDVKIAAAGDGNCPQYVSTQAQLDPMRTDGTSQDDQSQGGDSAHFNQEAGMSTPNETEIQLSEKLEQMNQQLVLLSETVQGYVAENAKLSEQLNLSEAHRLKQEKTLAEERARTLVDRYVDKGRITPHQSEIALSMLALGRGEEVHLSEADGTTKHATIEMLLSELLEANEPQVPLVEDGEEATRTVRPVSKDVHMSENDKFNTAMLARAREIAGPGNDWQPFVGRAAREVAVEARGGR